MKYLASFIITRNRSHVLRGTIEKIFAQTVAPEKILIVDNSDNDDTMLLVESMNNARLEYFRTGFNAGPAGGARFGLDILFSQGYEWVHWADDDDPPVFDDSIEKLLELAENYKGQKALALVGVVGERFNRNKAKLQRLEDEELKGIIHVVNVSGNMMPIVNRRVYEKGIIPDDKLFFSYEDLDFGLAIQRAGMVSIVQGDIFFDHRMRAGRLNFKRKGYYVKNTGALWREYYGVRNLVHILLRKEKAYAGVLVLTARTLAKSVYGFRFGFEYGWKNFAYLLLGLFDGYRNKLGMTVSPVPKKIFKN